MKPAPSTPISLTLRVLAHMLRYPGTELRAHLGELRDALRDERALSPDRLTELDALFERLRSLPPLAVEAAYVEVFDRGRGTSLHLFEHVHGDSRERGPALAGLVATYAQAGLQLAPGELPDYLPVALEYASTQPGASARDFLREMAAVLRIVFTALMARDAAYAVVVAALLDLAGEKTAKVALPDEPSLDEAWAEPPVFGGCSVEGQARPGEPQPIRLVRPSTHTAAAGVQR